MRRWTGLLVTAAVLAGCAASKPAGPPVKSDSGAAPAPAPQPPAKQKLVQGEDPGTTIQANYEPGKLPKVLPSFTDVPTGPLLFSDAPEYVEGTGVIMYSALKPGDFRFYLYHVNSNAKEAYFPVVLTNKGDKTATVKVGNNALPKPDSLYGTVGFAMQTTFYSGESKGWTISIKPGERAVLDPRLLTTKVQNTQLLAGIWDVQTDQPIDLHETISFAGELPDPTQMPQIPREDNGGAGVGTFTNYRRKALVQLNGTRQMYLLASGEGTDTWLKGKDELRGTAIGNLVGNYGMDYEVTMAFNSPVDRQVKVYMSTVMKLGGAIRVGGKMIRIPEDFFGNIDAPYDSVLIAKLDLKANQPTSFTYEFMPPGAFYLPAIVHVNPVQ